MEYDRKLLFKDLNYRIITLGFEVQIELERLGKYTIHGVPRGELDTLPDSLRKLATKIEKYLWLDELKPLVEYLSEVEDVEYQEIGKSD